MANPYHRIYPLSGVHRIDVHPSCTRFVARVTQRAQYPLIKEYTLNHNIEAPYNLRYIPYLRGIGLSGYV